jgi:uncharacterized protein YndB with AHSA1/START domain
MTAIPAPDRTRFRLPSRREVLAEHVVAAPRRLVWEAHTRPSHLRGWLGPAEWSMAVCDIDLRTGGSYRYEWRNAAGGRMAMHGVLRHVLPLSQLVSTESWGSGWPDTLNAMILDGGDGQVTVTHRILYPSHRAREVAMAAGLRQSLLESHARLDAWLVWLES